MNKSNPKSVIQSVIGLLVALSLPLGLSGRLVAQATRAALQQKPNSSPKATIATDALVAQAEEHLRDADIAQAEEHLRLVTSRFNNGVGTPDDVREAKIALADTRIRSAIDRNEFTGLQQDLETIVTQRQSLLDMLNVKLRSGIANPSEVNTAKEALAEARVRLDLYSVVLARQARLLETSVRQRSGISSPEEVGKVTASLLRAELRFVESGDDR